MLFGIAQTEKDGFGEAFRQVAGLGAGVAAVVYICGLAVLSLRLGAKQLPAEAVVVNLPRELVIVGGLTDVVVPLALAGAIVIAANYALLSLIPGASSVGNALDDWDSADNGERAILVGASAILFVAGCAVAVAFLESAPPAFAGAAVTPIAFLVGGRAIRKRYQTRLRSFAPVAWTAALVSVCFMPWWIVTAESQRPLLEATVCTTDGARKDGSLIGETTDRVYLGQRPRIVAIPRSRVQQVLIGKHGGCDPPTPGLEASVRGRSGLHPKHR